MSDRKAQDLLAQANKKAEHKGWFGGHKYEEAGELYEQAANQFKLAKQMREAGEAMNRAAEMSLQCNERNDAAQRFISAAKSFKKNYPQEAVKALKQAIALLTENGRFHAAASHQKEVAQLYESDLADLENAMEAYQLAADWYASEDSNALANGCLLKVAGFAAQLEKYERAIEIFERIAEASVDNQLTKWSIKDYFLKAGLCRLATADTIGARKALDHYKDLDMGFVNTRECKLLDNLIADAENEDLQGFTDHVAEFDQ
ncbi:vesicular-fusion protein S17, partial [Linderina macrospora]